MAGSYTCTVTSELSNLAVIAQFIADTARDLGCDKDTIYALQLAVDEACTNVMEYAYEGRGGQPVSVHCRREGNAVIISIRDRGQPFDPTRISDPDLHAPLARRQVGGWGLYLIRKLMDDVRFSFDPASGNELTLVKRIAPHADG